MTRQHELAEQRSMLIERIASQRQELARGFEGLKQGSSFVERGYSLAQGVRSHPKLAAVSSVAALFLLRKFLPIGMFTSTALTVAKAGFSYAKNKLFPRQISNS